MINTILVPVDGSANANRAVDFAGDLADKYDAKVVLLHAIHLPLGRLPDELHQFAVSENLDGPNEVGAVVNAMLRSAETRAANAGAPRTGQDSVIGDPATVILETAKSTGADLIVMGGRGLGGLEGLLLGSVSDKVLHHAEVPVTIVR